MNFFKKVNKNQEPDSSKEKIQYIQNFNAPVGVVQNSNHSTASVNQFLSPGESNSTSSETSKPKPEDSLSDPIILLVERFLEIYNNHGIRKNQIPKFASQFNLKLSNFTTHEAIIDILNEELIFWTCETFGINRVWLEGEPNFFNNVTSEIYDSFDCYKGLHSILDVFNQYYNHKKRPRDICLYAFKNGELTRETSHKSVVILVFRERVGEINQRPIFRYKPISTRWFWDYYKTRYQLKAIFMLCKKYRIEMHGYDLPNRIIGEIVDRIVFPQPIINNCFQYSWYPEDYIDQPHESCVAKESEELKQVTYYLRDNGYTKVLEAINCDGSIW